MHYIIAWRNKFSNETGYVQCLDRKYKRFVNTYDKNEAGTYTQSWNAKKAIEKLIEYGEGENNYFEVVKVYG